MKLRIFFFHFLFLTTVFASTEPSFDQLMGKERGAFQYVQTPEDFRRLNFYRDIYDKQIGWLKDHKNKVSAIPKVFHLIWLGPSNFPEASLPHLKKWMKHHPNWRFKFWTDLDRKPPLEEMERCLISDFSFKFMENPFHQTDNFREKTMILSYEILYQEGGTYLDHDLVPCETFDTLNESYHFYCGLEPLGPSILSTSVFPTIHLLGAAPKHPILAETMLWLDDHFSKLECQFPGTSDIAIKNRVLHRTLWALTKGIEAGLGQSGGRDIIFPSSYFNDFQHKFSHFATHLRQGQWSQHFTSFEAQTIHQLEKIAKLEEANLWTLLLFSGTGFALLVFLLLSRRSIARWLFFLLLFAADPLTANEFNRWMGEKTEHWAHVTQETDLQLLAKCRHLYEKNSLFLSAKEDHYKIPPQLHFIWLGPNPFPPGSVENVRSWIAHHPDWEIIFWTDREREPPCEGMKVRLIRDFAWLFLQECFEDSLNWGEKSDLLRFEILYQLGGTYVDHDANCLKRFHEVHRGYDFYCGLETPHPPFSGHNVTAGIGLFGARPGHHLIERVIYLIRQNWSALGKKYPGRDGYAQTQLVMERTYMMLTHALAETWQESNTTDIIFPAAYFFAKKRLPSFYSKHFYANSWANPEKRNLQFEKTSKHYLGKIQRRSYFIRWMTQAALLMNFLLILIIFKTKRV